MTLDTLYLPTLSGGGSTTLNGLIAHFVNTWSGSSTCLSLVNRSSDQTLTELPVFSIDTSNRQLEIDSQTTIETRELISMTTLPVLVVGERVGLSPLVVSGLAAVCRYVVKNSHDPALRQVLGFRSNCLQAPAEVSLWTAFCECQMTESTLMFLSRSTDGEDVIELPAALVQFEEHLKQPVRMHNILRHAQQLQQSVASGPIDSKEAASLVSHTYAEGPDMTLADLLLYPCVRLVTDRLTACGVALTEYLPRVALWLLTMATSVDSAWTKATTTALESSLTRLSIIHHSSPAVKVPRVRSTSLYKKDTTRTRPSIVAVNANETARLVDSLNRQRIWPSPECVGEGSTDLPTGLVLLFDSANSTEADDGASFISRIDWSSLPEPAHPRYGQVPGSRLERKIQQLDGMAAAVIDCASLGDVIVDFCSGGGHLGIVLAHLLPGCRVIMVDNKEASIGQARKRLAQLKLPNATLVQSNLDYFIRRFDLGVALHACGVATDLVLDKCRATRASFVLCPCCYGNLALDMPVSYPRSRLFYQRGITPSDHSLLARLADHVTATGRSAMAAVDLDRAAVALEDGYRVTLTKLKPDSCSPKHDLLIGMPIV